MIRAVLASFILGCIGGWSSAKQLDEAKIFILETTIERGIMQAEADAAIACAISEHNQRRNHE